MWQGRGRISQLASLSAEPGGASKPSRSAGLKLDGLWTSSGSGAAAIVEFARLQFGEAEQARIVVGAFRGMAAGEVEQNILAGLRMQQDDLVPRAGKCCADVMSDTTELSQGRTPTLVAEKSAPLHSDHPVGHLHTRVAAEPCNTGAERHEQESEPDGHAGEEE